MMSNDAKPHLLVLPPLILVLLLMCDPLHLLVKNLRNIFNPTMITIPEDCE